MITFQLVGKLRNQRKKKKNKMKMRYRVRKEGQVAMRAMNSKRL